MAPLPPLPPVAPPADARRLVLMQAGGCLLGGGLPTSDVEDELRALSRDIGVPDARVAAWPNGLFVALSAEDSTGFEPVRAPLRFDQTSAVLEVIAGLRTGVHDVHGALAAIARIRSLPPRWPHWVADLGAVPVGVGLCLLLQPAPSSVAMAAVASLLVAAMTFGARQVPVAARLLPVVSAFAVSLLVLGAFEAHLVEGPLRTIVAVLAILLPGSAVVTGLTEIASGDPAAGSSRLVSGAVQLALFFAGIVGAATVLGVPLSALGNSPPPAVSWWMPVVGIALATVGLVQFLYPPMAHLGWVVLGVAVAAAVQVSLNLLAGPAVGGLAGAVAAALAAILISWAPRGPSWQVTFQPAFVVVAPGSFGFLNASQVHLGTGAGAGTAVYTALSAFVAIAIGTLIGAVLARASDRVVRHRPAPMPAADGAERG